jgi:hypothetical protein
LPPSPVSVELQLDNEAKLVWMKVTTEDGEMEIGIPPVEAYGLGEALIKAVGELGFEGNPSSDPKVAN